MDSIVATADGSSTFYSAEFDEHYHSLDCGAFTESMYKHVLPAFSIPQVAQKNELNILDICFGLGYNTLATLEFLKAGGIDAKINIFSPEMDGALVRSLADFEYPPELCSQQAAAKSIAQSLRYDEKNISVQVIIGDAREFINGFNGTFDIVYQDPFSPQKNRLLWTLEYFSLLRSKMSEHSVLTTYTVSSPVRAALYELGFFMYAHDDERIRAGTIATTFDAGLPNRVDFQEKLRAAPRTKPLRD